MVYLFNGHENKGRRDTCFLVGDLSLRTMVANRFKKIIVRDVVVLCDAKPLDTVDICL